MMERLSQPKTSPKVTTYEFCRGGNLLPRGFTVKTFTVKTTLTATFLGCKSELVNLLQIL